MKTVQITPAEMEARIARFRSTTPQSGYYADSGIPREAYELMTAKSLYLMMAPPTQGGPMAAKPAIVGAKGMSLIVAECPPGDKPLLHAHFRTRRRQDDARTLRVGGDQEDRGHGRAVHVVDGGLASSDNACQRRHAGAGE
jgi:hypothetical protein